MKVMKKEHMKINADKIWKRLQYNLTDTNINKQKESLN